MQSADNGKVTFCGWYGQMKGTLCDIFWVTLLIAYGLLVMIGAIHLLLVLMAVIALALWVRSL